jgi:hypothetical protein
LSSSVRSAIFIEIRLDRCPFKPGFGLSADVPKIRLLVPDYVRFWEF